MKQKWLIFSLFVLTACSGDPESLIVTKEQYGDDWPLSVESGTLICDGTAIVIKTSKGDFRLNGGNGSKYYEFLDTTNIQLIDEDMWKQLDKPDDFKPRKSVSNLIDRGQTLCE